MLKDKYWYLDCEGFATYFEAKPEKDDLYCPDCDLEYTFLGKFTLDTKEVNAVHSKLTEIQNKSENDNTYDEYVKLLISTLVGVEEIKKRLELRISKIKKKEMV